MKILAIGGCGSMGRYAMRAVQNFSSVDKIIIADINKESADFFAASLIGSLIKAIKSIPDAPIVL